jgi:hypothetical protein
MRVVILAAVLTLLIGPAAQAHEGHQHKLMGTVIGLKKDRVEIKTTEAKTEAVVLNDKTRILRGTRRLKEADIKVGERIVALAIEQKDKSLMATELRLAAPAAQHR